MRTTVKSTDNQDNHDVMKARNCNNNRLHTQQYSALLEPGELWLVDSSLHLRVRFQESLQMQKSQRRVNEAEYG